MILQPNLRGYVGMNGGELLTALADVTEQICALHAEVATAEIGEITARVDGWKGSVDNATIKSREMAAYVQAAPAKQTLIDLKADLAIKTEEKWFLLRLLNGDTRGGPG